MRSVFRNVCALAGLAVATSLSVVGCSAKSDKPETAGPAGDPTVGRVGLQLQVAPNANVTTIHYKLSQNGVAVPAKVGAGDLAPEGDIPVPGNNKDFVFALTFPVGTGYSIALSAVWDDPDTTKVNPDITCAGGVGPFDVAPGTEIGVSAPMLCKDVSSGDVVVAVDVTSTACPDLHMGYAIATPRATTVGSPVSVLSAATDDVAGTPVTFAWTVTPATGGTFATPGTANTTFNCAAPSAAGTPHRLTVTATAGTGASACKDTLSVEVSCANLLCGNGIPDPGENCDDAHAPGGCPDDCIMMCGNAKVEGTEACDFDSGANPTGTATCKADCTLRTPVCGDHFVTSPETCDDGNTVSNDGCSATCVAEAAAACGDGVKSGTEACDPTALPGTYWNCSDTCKVVSTPACETAEDACKDPGLLASCNDPGLTTAARSACYKLLLCMKNDPGKCAAISPDPCLCGALSNGDCAAKATIADVTGACKQEFADAMGTNKPSEILVDYTAAALGGSHAVQRIFCEEFVAPTQCL